MVKKTQSRGRSADGKGTDRPRDDEEISETTQQTLDEYSQDAESVIDDIRDNTERRREITETLDEHGEDGSTPYREAWSGSEDEQQPETTGGEVYEEIAPTEAGDSEIRDSVGQETVGDWEPTPRKSSAKEEVAQELVQDEIPERGIGEENAAAEGSIPLGDAISESSYEELNEAVSPPQTAVTETESGEVKGTVDGQQMLASRQQLRQRGAYQQGRTPEQGVWAESAGSDIAQSTDDYGVMAGAGLSAQEGMSAGAAMGGGTDDPYTVHWEGVDDPEHREPRRVIHGENRSLELDPNELPASAEEAAEGKFREFEELQNQAVEVDSQGEGDRAQGHRKHADTSQVSDVHPDVFDFTSDIPGRELTVTPWDDVGELPNISGPRARRLEREKGITSVGDLADFSSQDLEDINHIGAQTAGVLEEAGNRANQVHEAIENQVDRLVDETHCKFGRSDFEYILTERAKNGHSPESTADKLLSKSGRAEMPGEATPVSELEPFTQRREIHKGGLDSNRFVEEKVNAGHETVRGGVVEVVEAGTLENMAGDQYQMFRIRDDYGDETLVTVWQDSVEYPDEATETDVASRMGEGRGTDVRQEGIHPDEDRVTRGDVVHLKNVQVNQSTVDDVDGLTVSTVPETEVVFLKQSSTPQETAPTGERPSPPSSG